MDRRLYRGRALVFGGGAGGLLFLGCGAGGEQSVGRVDAYCVACVQRLCALVVVHGHLRADGGDVDKTCHAADDYYSFLA